MITALYDMRGCLLWASRYLAPPESCLGQAAWVNTPQDEGIVKSHLGRAIMGDTSGPLETVAVVCGCPMRFRVMFHPAPQQAVACIATAKTVDDRIASLSGRELEILRLLPACTRRQIASRLGISRHTVDTHINRVRAKLRLSGAQLVSWAVLNLG